MTKHYVSSGLIFDENKILLIKHKKFGTWIYPGGHFEVNENPEECLCREIQEETGYTVDIDSLNLFCYKDMHAQTLHQPFCILEEWIMDKTDKTHIHVDFVYLCKLNKNQVRKKEREDIEYGWFTYSQTQSLEMLDNFKSLLTAAFEYKQIL